MKIRNSIRRAKNVIKRTIDVFDSVSIFTSFKDKLAEAGVIFCPISEAIHEYPELVKKHGFG